MPTRISFRNLQTFLVIADHLNMSRAAEVLHIAQPALSQQLQLMERRLDVQLFERNVRPMRLTEAGQLFHVQAALLLAQFNTTVSQVRDVHQGRDGWLGLGFTRSAMYSFLPPHVRAFHQALPRVKIHFHEMLTEEQPDALRQGIIHLGLARDPEPQAGLDQLVVSTEPLVVVLPADHRLAGESVLELARLAGDPLVIFPRHPAATFPRRVLNLCREAGFEPEVVQQAYEIGTALGMVSAGLGFTVASAAIAGRYREDVRAMPFTLNGKAPLSHLVVQFITAELTAPARKMLELMDSEPL